MTCSKCGMPLGEALRAQGKSKHRRCPKPEPEPVVPEPVVVEDPE